MLLPILLTLSAYAGKPGFNVMPGPAAAPAASPVASAVPAPDEDPGSAPKDEDPAIEAVRAQERYRKAMEALNTANPVSETFGKETEPGMPSSPELERIRKLQRLMSNPVLQSYVKLFQSPKLLEASTVILESPNKTALIYAELGLLVFLFFLRTWWTARAKNWIQRFCVNVYAFVAYVPLALIVIPWLLLGSPYVKLVSAIAATTWEQLGPRVPGRVTASPAQAQVPAVSPAPSAAQAPAGATSPE